MALQNFVSISGISYIKQLQEIDKICQEEFFNFPIVIGYQVSNKSINLGTQNPRQPKFKKLGNLSKQTLEYGFIPSIHYYTKDDQAIISDLEKVAEGGVEPNSGLLQFNTLPFSKDVLMRVKKMGFNIIFKVAVSDKQTSEGGYAVWKGKDTQDVKEGSIKPLIAQVQERRDFIDYVMFDPSHGTNLNLDLNEKSLAIRFGKEITSIKDLNHLGLVYAGGIKPNNVERVVKNLYSFFPHKISIDTESGIRNKENQLDLNLVKDYLINFRKTVK